eukprot:gene12954-biopygen5435
MQRERCTPPWRCCSAKHGNCCAESPPTAVTQCEYGGCSDQPIPLDRLPPLPDRGNGYCVEPFACLCCVSYLGAVFIGTVYVCCIYHGISAWLYKLRGGIPTK